MEAGCKRTLRDKATLFLLRKDTIQNFQLQRVRERMYSSHILLRLSGPCCGFSNSTPLDGKKLWYSLKEKKEIKQPPQCQCRLSPICAQRIPLKQSKWDRHINGSHDRYKRKQLTQFRRRVGPSLASVSHSLSANVCIHRVADGSILQLKPKTATCKSGNRALAVAKKTPRDSQISLQSVHTFHQH